MSALKSELLGSTEDPELKRFGLLWRIFDLLIKYKKKEIIPTLSSVMSDYVPLPIGRVTTPTLVLTDQLDLGLGTWICGEDFLSGSSLGV